MVTPVFQRFRPHPWHGLPSGPETPQVVTAYIELTPFDAVKYEMDKASGYLRVDRPQRGSAQPPALYGFIPRTYCAKRTADLAGVENGDGDPLDICVFSERPITRSDIVLSARVVGGLQMLDKGEADDKIVAVLENDRVWGDARELTDLPANVVERLIHYFSTYKMIPGEPPANVISIARSYDRVHAQRVIQAAVEDYAETFGG